MKPGEILLKSGITCMFTDIRTLKGTIKKSQPYIKYIKALKAAKIIYGIKTMTIDKFANKYPDSCLRNYEEWNCYKKPKNIAIITFKKKESLLKGFL